MTAQDAAGVTVAFVALERSETLAVAREAAGQPPPAAAGWERWPDGPLHPISVRTDPSIAGVTGAASRPGEGRFPSREQAQPRAFILAGCRATLERGAAALPPAAKPQRKVNRSPLCGSGSRELLPSSFSPCTGRSGDAPALEQERAVAAVWLGPSIPYHPSAGAAGVPLPASPHLWGPAWGLQSFDGAVDLLSARRLSAKLGRSGTSLSFGVRSDWARGARPCRHPCRAPAALFCGSSAPPLLFQSWVKGPFLPMARSKGGNQEFTRLVTEFRHPFFEKPPEARVCGNGPACSRAELV